MSSKLLPVAGLLAIIAAIPPDAGAQNRQLPLKIDRSDRHLAYQGGEPFLWIGGTAWGMTEWLTREEVDLYLDDRRAKGMNVIQLCLFWGKRTDNPTSFTANPENAYGHKALREFNGLPNPLTPATARGGSPSDPNDYWDHVEYCLQAIAERDMQAAVLPVWGRRYVNASHEGHSKAIFDETNIGGYGRFLGKRFAAYPHIIWVMGGDVSPESSHDHTGTYRKLAQGIAEATPDPFPWLMTYHPLGDPEQNSSKWFHRDRWLDFNMIETYRDVDAIAGAVRHDYNLRPTKPTILAEGSYEGAEYGDGKRTDALSIRRQAYQSFFAGAAGFTYGAAFGPDGNGPLFSPANNWQPLLDLPGAAQLLHLRRFLESHHWPDWQPAPEAIADGRGAGELEKLATRADDALLIYFPDNTPVTLTPQPFAQATWFNPTTGQTTVSAPSPSLQYTPPPAWPDAILHLGL